MTEISVFRPGSVSYLCIAAPDVGLAAIFYRAVFGRQTDMDASLFEDATDDRRAELLGMDAEDRYDLQRFVAAQDAAGTYQHAVAELRGGRKSSHWMWFVFPQIAGLGYSPTARAYAITSLAEARAYLAHPVLGARLAECAAILTAVSGRTAEQIFGEVDAMKLHSSMTLFMRAAPDKPVFREVLDQYFDGIPDSATEQRI